MIRRVLGLGRWVRIGWCVVASVMKEGMASLLFFCSREFHARIQHSGFGVWGCCLRLTANVGSELALLSRLLTYLMSHSPLHPNETSDGTRPSTSTSTTLVNSRWNRQLSNPLLYYAFSFSSTAMLLVPVLNTSQQIPTNQWRLYHHGHLTCLGVGCV